KFPANRENNREFCRICPSTVMFVSDQRAGSIAYTGIPYATEQGIYKRVSGNFFQGTGRFRQCAKRPIACTLVLVAEVAGRFPGIKEGSNTSSAIAPVHSDTP